MKKLIIGLTSAIFILAGCGQEDDNSTREESVPDIIEAILDVPENGDAGEEIQLEVTVKQGDEMVEDANEVVFEVWQEGKKEEGKMLEASHEEKGKYVAAITFEADGMYHVQSHVTAREMHTMPKKTITIGNGEEVEHNHEEAEEQDHSHGHAHGAVGMALDTAPKQVKANEDTMIAVSLTYDEKPLEAARTRLEIKSPKNEVNWLNLQEEDAGNYSSTYQFSEAGVYTIVIHVENDDGIHEHESVEMKVE